jgi:hypothetical protein
MAPVRGVGGTAVGGILGVPSQWQPLQPSGGMTSGGGTSVSPLGQIEKRGSGCPSTSQTAIWEAVRGRGEPRAWLLPVAN